MRYSVTLAGRPILGNSRTIDPGTLPFIPETEQEVTLDTDSGAGQVIWDGYLQMREAQKKQPLPDDDWMKVRVPEDADPKNEIHKFREAINIFLRFLAGESRDNCNAVKDIRLAA